MNLKYQKCALFLTFSLIVAFPSISLAISSDSAGKVAFVLGQVEKKSANGDVSRVTKSTIFNKSDVINTKKNGQLMILMADSSKITIRPNTTFRIDNYSYNQDIQTDKSHYGLVEGGFRFITGKMGKNNKSSYKLTTAMGTIGIRGTDFETNICENSCSNDKGLFVKVISGGVSLNNNAGTIDISPGDIGHIEAQNIVPEQVDQLPDVMIISSQNNSDSTKASGASKQASPEEQMVALSLKSSQGFNDSSINDLVAAGLPNKAILTGASMMGMEPANIANAMIFSGANSSDVIKMSMEQFPQHSANILTMGIATRAINTQQANTLGKQNGMTPSKLKSAVTTGKLIRPPTVNKAKENEATKSTKQTSDKVDKKPPSRSNQAITPKRANPQLVPKDGNAGGPVPSPS